MINAPLLSGSRKKPDRRSRWGYARYSRNRATVIRSNNLSLLLYAQAFMWFHKIAEFRAAESHLLYARKPDKKRRAEHRQIITNLILEGRDIVRRIHANGGLIKPANGFSVQDILSTIDELENTQLQWNGTMARKQKDEILKTLFDAA